ncbi:hypothetical protein CEG14_15360 [Bordetella genomosp. 1]|jgi:hypothetical protein|uniref:Uncharacterized protein n=1 Tax=Bordetella genomosp. 1 TaxID=1395607 RepID=A0A261SG72_9BORD|nr:hypothetical protein [Bordetella genomosp. 1]MDQ8035026.1 hypothetical protein [Bordetella sp.]OZI36376.1 hypothetical protein CEG14_15360 [Bordetella genomosp. 1]OZI57834.1 hypothetical protein CAL27_20755 [Bordetella genomosp. 1]
MGTAKYDHPGFVADTGTDGQYLIGIWCPHGYPAHIHIGRLEDNGKSEAQLRLRIPDSVFQSMPDDVETLCRRAMGQAVREHLLNGATGFQETRLQLDAVPWAGPMRAMVAA